MTSGIDQNGTSFRSKILNQICGHFALFSYAHKIMSKFYRHIKVIKSISKEDCVLHMVYRAMEHEAGELPKDFVILCSQRKTQGKRCAL